MSLKMNHFSRAGLALLLVLGMASSGCASWNKLIGKKEEPSPKLNLAWARLKESEGNLTDARHGYEQVLAKDPKSIDAILGMARLNLKANRLADAEAGFETALALKPKSTEVLSEIGNFYSDQKRWDKAIPLLQEAQRLEPHEKNYQFNLAVALAKSGRTNEAIPHFKAAVGDAEAHYNVGRILVESGKRTEAEEQFVLALTKNPSLSDAQFFLDEIRAGSSGKAQPLPVVASASLSGHSALQVGGTAPVQTAENPNPFEEAPTSGYSESSAGAVRPVRNSQTQGNSPFRGPSRPIPSGRQPLYQHQGYEELPPPSSNGDSPVGRSSASSQASASSIILASAEVPAEVARKTQPSPRAPAPGLIVPNRIALNSDAGFSRTN